MEITVYVVVAVLLSLSVFSSKLSDRFGIPAILLFNPGHVSRVGRDWGHTL